MKNRQMSSKKFFWGEGHWHKTKIQMRLFDSFTPYQSQTPWTLWLAVCDKGPFILLASDRFMSEKWLWLSDQCFVIQYFRVSLHCMVFQTTQFPLSGYSTCYSTYSFVHSYIPSTCTHEKTDDNQGACVILHIQFQTSLFSLIHRQ